MRNLRNAVTQGHKRSSSIISRIRAHQRDVAGATDSSGSSRSVEDVDAAFQHAMQATPYFLARPSVLT